MTIKSVGIMLRTEGKPEVKNDFAEVGKAGEAAFDSIGQAAQQSAATADAAVEQMTKKQADAYAKLAAAAEKSGLSAPAPQIYDTRGAASADLANIKIAAALKGELDPTWAATQKLNAELERLAAIERLNVLSADELAAAEVRVRTAFDQTVTAQGRATGSAGAQRAAMQNLSYQVQDTFTQLSMGANVFQVLAIQGGQAAGAFAGVGGAAGKVASFLIGPWGLAITGALLVLGPLASSLIKFNSDLDDAVDKLKKDAAQTAITTQAKDLYRHSAEGVAQAIRDSTAATQSSIESEKSAATRAVEAAKANLAEEISIRSKTQARLEDAQALLKSQVTRAAGPGQQGDLAALSLGRYQDQVTNLQQDIAKQAALIAEARAKLVAAGVDVVAEDAKRDADATARINKLYDDEINAAKAVARTKADLDEQDKRRLKAQLDGIEVARKAALQAEADKKRAASGSDNANRQTGREVSLSQAEAIVKSIGGVITSTTRTYEQQAALYAKYLAGTGPMAAKPGTSDHEYGGAIDIAKSPGMSLAKIRAAFTEQGVQIKQLLDEGNHFHIAWGKAANDAGDATREAAKQQEGYVNTLKTLTGEYLPVAAAAKAYADQLKAIATFQNLPASNAAHIDLATAQQLREGAQRKYLKVAQPELFAQEQGTDVLLAADKAREAAAKRASAQIDDQKASLAYGEREIALAGAQEGYRERALAKLNAILGLKRDGIDADSADGLAILANADAIEVQHQKLQLLQNSWQEIRDFGQHFVDDVLNPDNWSSWGNLAKTVLKDLENEFIKLALLNPLKNLISGKNDLPGLGSIFGSILGGGHNLDGTPISNNLFGLLSQGNGIGHNATGSANWSGGATWVNENGPEIADLPSGTRIYPAAETRRMLASNDNTGGGGHTVIINANDAVLAETVRG